MQRVEITRNQFETMTGVKPPAGTSSIIYYGGEVAVIEYFFVDEAITPEQTFYSDGFALLSQEMQVSYLESLLQL